MREAELLDRAEIVADVLSGLADDTTPEGRELRESALAESGLSGPMIDWALRETMAGLPTDFEVLVRSANVDGAALVRRAALVLSGNVFTAPAEPLAIHAIAGTTTHVKVSSVDGSFAQAFVNLLERKSHEMRALFTLSRFDRSDHDAMAEVMRDADVVTAFGGDKAMRDLAAQLPPAARFNAYGHGFGAIALDADCADDELLRNIALDVAAYDQRGCRSPQVIFVTGDDGARRDFAKRLSHALGELEEALPRGKLNTATQAHERRWRDTMRALGDLYETPTASVAAVDAGTPITTPLHRNIQVHPLSAMKDFAEFAVRAGKHLKVVGLTYEHITILDNKASRAFVGGLPHAALTTIGSMQRPRMHDYLLLRSLVDNAT